MQVQLRRSGRRATIERKHVDFCILSQLNSLVREIEIVLYRGSCVIRRAARSQAGLLLWMDLIIEYVE
jgi:hypothetical protein